MSREMGSKGGFWGFCSRASWVRGGPIEHGHLCHDKNSAWAVGAWLCLKLLRKWREHAQVSKVLDVIVASPLRRVPRHGQHVLERRRTESPRGQWPHPQPALVPESSLPLTPLAISLVSKCSFA